MTKLEVLICTCGSEAPARIGDLPAVEGVAYIIACQCDECAIPQRLDRPDVKVRFTPTCGLSHNRNFALSCATAPYVLIADDDLIFYPEGLLAIIDAFESHPGISVAAFRSVQPSRRVYPACEHDLFTPYKYYNTASVEIALRRGEVARRGLRFSPLFGLGAPYLQAAEENIFLLNARRTGMRGRFFPIDIVEHPGLSTGERSESAPGMLRAQGAYAAMRYGATAPLRICLKAMRSAGPKMRNLLWAWQGAVFAWRRKKQILMPRKDPESE